MSHQHVPIQAGNVRVFFPFKPYSSQEKYIQSVVKALTNKQHAILESPTGTGKTLSLLCSTLAWHQKYAASEKSIIYYTSRTHMQLSQAAKEMKRSAYSRVPSVVIGSRAKMCLNDDVKSQAGDHLINRACRNAVTKNSCSYHMNYEQKLQTLDFNNVHDIEDLCSFGHTNQCCPYYAAKKIAEIKASLVFMPYNYLLDTSLRKSLQLKVENSVIIFDEAHNIEGALKDAVSGNFSLICLNNLQESCCKLPAKIHEALNRERHGFSRAGYDPKKSMIVDEVSNKKANTKQQEKEPKVNPIEELAEKLTNERLQEVNRIAECLKTEIKSMKMDETSTIDKVFHIMKQAGIEYSTSDRVVTTLESMASFWSMAGVMNPALVARYVTSITNVCHVVSLLYPSDCLSMARQNVNEKQLIEYYTAYLEGVYETSQVIRKGEVKEWKLNLWCLLPAIGLKRIIESNCINGPRSFIVTSGTLCPLQSIAKELNVEFKVTGEFEHVIDETQFKMTIIGESPNGYPLESSFKSVSQDKYPLELGKTLLPLFQVLPFGTLVFFPSYSVMARVVKYWKEKSKIWKEMTASTEVLVESVKQETFSNDVLNFKKIINTKSKHGGKAVFLGVFRGKLSEGINFEGNQCRSVILTGLPFPSIKDPKVVSTRKFHEKLAGNENGGQIWYSQQMLRALNQSIGRVIRSRTDFGMLFLCDPRFKGYKWSLSRWTRDFFPSSETAMQDVESDIKEFFKSHNIVISQTATENHGAFDISISSNSRPGLVVSQSTPKEQPPTAQAAIKDIPVGDGNKTTSSLDATKLILDYRVNTESHKIFQARRKQQLEDEPAPVKKSKVAASTTDTASIFDSILGAEYHPPKPLTNSQSTSQSSSYNSKKEYSIVEEHEREYPNKAYKYKCCICKEEANDPHVTNCECGRVGCLKCLQLLNKKRCHEIVGKNGEECGTLLLSSKFKRKMFLSATMNSEKYTKKDEKRANEASKRKPILNIFAASR